jgi:hypothetical protein
MRVAVFLNWLEVLTGTWQYSQDNDMCICSHADSLAT